MQNHQQSSNTRPFYNAFYGPNYVTGANNMGLARPSSNVQRNAPSSNLGHNIMPAPSPSSSLQYAASIGTPAAGHMQHDNTHTLPSSSSMQHAAHQGQAMRNTPNAAAPPPDSQQHIAQGGDIWQKARRFLMTAPIGRLRGKLWQTFRELSQRNKDYRALQTSFEASEKRREEVEQENSELREQLDAKTQESEGVQAFMNEDLVRAMQADFEPRLQGLRTELSNTGIALDAKAQECEQLRRNNAAMERLVQGAMPARLSDREVIERLNPMNRPDVHELLPLMLPETQGAGQPTMLMYPASQPSAYENNGYTHASNEGLQTMPPTGNTHSSPLIDLTEDDPEALAQDFGSTTNQSGGIASTFTSISSHGSSDASAITTDGSGQASSAPSPRIDSCDPANVGNQLKRGAEAEIVNTVKKPRRSTYDWLVGSGNPAKPMDDWTKVRGGVVPDARSSYLYTQDNEWEKRKKKHEIRCKKDGVDPKDRPFEAIEEKPSVQRARASAQRSETKKRVPKAKARRPASLAVSTGTPQIERVEDHVAEVPETIQGRDQQCSQGKTVSSDDAAYWAEYEAEVEAALERASEDEVDEATVGQGTEAAKTVSSDDDASWDEYAADVEAELERASEDQVDEATVGPATEAAEPIPDGFLPDDGTDMDSLFGGDLDDQTPDDDGTDVDSLFGGDLDDQTSDDEDEPKHPTGPAIYPRPAGPALYHEGLPIEFNEADIKSDKSFRLTLVRGHHHSFTQLDLLKDRTLLLIVARVHGNAWAEATPSKNTIHNEPSTVAAPAKTRDSPSKSRDGKGRVEKAPKKKAAAKKPRLP